MRTLAVRLDSMGDVLVTGPAIRALAHGSDAVDLLCGPPGRAAAELLPGVDRVLCWSAPWILADPPPVDPDDVATLTGTVREGGYDRAVIFTSFHQSPLPTALLLRLAGVPWVGAISVDYPGSLLDLRHRVDDDVPEPERALSLAYASGAELPPGDDGRLRLRPQIAGPGSGSVGHGQRRTVVLHPGTSAPARAWPPERFRALCSALAQEWDVLVTGGAEERELTAYVAGECGRDLGGRLGLAELAGVIAGADAIVVGNTGPAHLAAAVGTPVVSLFAPTVPAVRWAPYGVARVLLGDQDAPCRGTRATTCPVPGHPCLTSVAPHDVAAALVELCGRPRPRNARLTGRKV